LTQIKEEEFSRSGVRSCTTALEIEQEGTLKAAVTEYRRFENVYTHSRSRLIIASGLLFSGSL
jgi:hypothetical protein